MYWPLICMPVLHGMSENNMHAGKWSGILFAYGAGISSGRRAGSAGAVDAE